MLVLRSSNSLFFLRQIGACPHNGMLRLDIYWPCGQACRGSGGPSPDTYKLRLLLMSSNMIRVGRRPLKVIVDSINICMIYGSVALANGSMLISPSFCPGILAKFYHQVYQHQSMRGCLNSLKVSRIAGEVHKLECKQSSEL